jgi:hypothetical protein
MSDITMHLTANFYPPIPHDIQLSVQEMFDELVYRSVPYIMGDPDDESTWQFELYNEDALEMEWELPNGKTVKARDALDELRLWEALWMEAEPPEDTDFDYAESQEIPGQLQFWTAE